MQPINSGVGTAPAQPPALPVAAAPAQPPSPAQPPALPVAAAPAQPPAPAQKIVFQHKERSYAECTTRGGHNECSLHALLGEKDSDGRYVRGDVDGMSPRKHFIAQLRGKMREEGDHITFSSECSSDLRGNYLISAQKFMQQEALAYERRRALKEWKKLQTSTAPPQNTPPSPPPQNTPPPKRLPNRLCKEWNNRDVKLPQAQLQPIEERLLLRKDFFSAYLKLIEDPSYLFFTEDIPLQASVYNVNVQVFGMPDGPNEEISHIKPDSRVMQNAEEKDIVYIFCRGYHFSRCERVEGQPPNPPQSGVGGQQPTPPSVGGQPSNPSSVGGQQPTPPSVEGQQPPPPPQSTQEQREKTFFQRAIRMISDAVSQLVGWVISLPMMSCAAIQRWLFSPPENAALTQKTVFQYAERRYAKCATRAGNNECALHALLGEKDGGCYFRPNIDNMPPREHFIARLCSSITKEENGQINFSPLPEAQEHYFNAVKHFVQSEAEMHSERQLSLWKRLWKWLFSTRPVLERSLCEQWSKLQISKPPAEEGALLPSEEQNLFLKKEIFQAYLKRIKSKNYLFFIQDIPLQACVYRVNVRVLGMYPGRTKEVVSMESYVMDGADEEKDIVYIWHENTHFSRCERVEG